MPYNTEEMQLIAILESSGWFIELLHSVKKLNLKNYYIGAGCLTQCVWNALYGLPSKHGIKDIDLVYFDALHLDEMSENQIAKKASEILKVFDFEIDVKNQARVHLWYEQRFGCDIEAYESLEAAIRTWPTTATAVGIRFTENFQYEIYAPFGLTDLLSGIVKANPVQITKEVYEKKVSRWLTLWPDLSVAIWEESFI